MARFQEQVMVRSPLISVENAGMGFVAGSSVTRVLEKVSFDCDAGQLIGIAGSNGAGKSTLLRTVAGLQPLLEGSVRVDGAPISGTPHNLRARRISVVLTERVGGFNLTVFDAVAAGRLPYTGAFHQLTDNDRSVIHGAMEVTGVRALAGRPLDKISDGQYQKVMVARALAQETPVVALDEPNAYLDYASKHQLFGLLKEQCEARGMCVLISSHELDLVARYCHRVLIVGDGRVSSLNGNDFRSDPGFIALGGGFL
jgi:iron complex transport system ATP-binding protein